MHTKRIIPCLDVNNGRVVKGTNFVNLRDAGDPIEVGKEYDKAGADELVFWILRHLPMPEQSKQSWYAGWRRQSLSHLL